MDVESVRSNRSEKSDRSRKSKRLQLTIHPLSQVHTSPDGQSKLMHPARGPMSSTPVDPSMMQNTDLNLRPMTPSNLAVTQSMQQQQRPQGPSYSMYNWMPPPAGMPMGPNFTAYPQPNPYSPMVWSSQQQQPMAPASYPHQVGAFPGSGMPLPNPQQPVQSMSHTGFVSPVQQLYAPTPQMGSTSSNTQSPPHTESYRPESSQIPPPIPTQPQPVAAPNPAPQSYETHLSHGGHHDDTAWVEEATAVTGATSETGLSGGDNLSRFGARFGLAASLGLQPGAGYGISGAAAALIRTEADEINVYSCSHVLGLLASTLVAFGALISPVLMLLLPHFPLQVGWDTEACQPTCEGHLIGISVKLVLLSLATWVLSSPCRALCAGTAILPRVRLCRTLFLCLVFVVLFAFWLFYTVRVIQPREPEYLSIVLFADSLTDTLLFLHYAGIGLMELRKTRHRYAIHIVRSPDGMSKTLKCGEMSLQRAALEVLQFYMIEFTAFTPGQTGSVSGGKRGRGRSGVSGGGGAPSDPGSNTGGGGSRYKFYDVDGSGTGLVDKTGSGVGYTTTMGQTNGAVNTAVPSASARLYEELELEKRTRKRRMRLLLAVEDAFTHVRRLASETCADGNAGQASLPLNPPGNGIMFKTKFSQEKSLDPYEAAQAVFPTLIRPLQKYMRVTRQQARHPVDMVIDHLALCLAYGLSPHAFLERFNPAAATPQLDAAAAATAIRTAKRDRKQQQQQQQQVHPRSGRPSHSNGLDNGPLLPKHVYPGGQQAWSIVADRALSRSLADGAIFQLRRGSELSLLCTVRRLPLIRLIEEVLEPLEAGRFALNTDNAV
ncbi:unnamed protein product [Echinostoma caproni]|uniref:Vang-like protein n=1 Tax=Echinostoma caproni TaxID=27848 RepID=A0A183A5H6_9TREM|nr:unnamed protein product [Echinostoma caproni]